MLQVRTSQGVSGSYPQPCPRKMWATSGTTARRHQLFTVAKRCMPGPPPEIRRRPSRRRGRLRGTSSSSISNSKINHRQAGPVRPALEWSGLYTADQPVHDLSSTSDQATALAAFADMFAYLHVASNSQCLDQIPSARMHPANRFQLHGAHCPRY